MKTFPFSFDGASSRKKSAESVNIQGKPCMSIGRGLISCAPHVCTTRAASNYYCSTSMKVC
ncbi:hypothetical protein CR513_02384, partial [Mucuna pruriens]